MKITMNNRRFIVTLLLCLLLLAAIHSAYLLLIPQQEIYASTADSTDYDSVSQEYDEMLREKSQETLARVLSDTQKSDFENTVDVSFKLDELNVILTEESSKGGLIKMYF